MVIFKKGLRLFVPPTFDPANYPERLVTKAAWVLDSMRRNWAYWMADEEGWIQLHSKIIQEVITANKDWQDIRTLLIEHDGLEINHSYIPNQKSKGYRLPTYKGWHPMTFVDEKIERKLRMQKPATLTVHSWLVTHLKNLQIDEAKALEIIKTLTPRDDGISPAEYHDILRCQIQGINHDTFFAPDWFGRVHTHLTHLPEPLRCCLTLDGERLTAIDVKNCQPLLIGVMARRYFNDGVLRGAFDRTFTDDLGKDDVLVEIDRLFRATCFNSISSSCSSSVSSSCFNYSSNNCFNNSVFNSDLFNSDKKEEEERIKNKKNKELRKEQEQEDKNKSLLYIKCSEKKNRSNRREEDYRTINELNDIKKRTRKHYKAINEIEQYIDLCETGQFYELFTNEQRTRSQVKKEMLKVFFSSNYQQVEMKKEFKQQFPRLDQFIRRIKKGNYERLAHMAQSYESILIIRSVCGRFMNERPEVPVLTLHDAIYTTATNADYVADVMQDEFRSLGINPKLERTEY